MPRGTNAPPSVRPSHDLACSAGLDRLVGGERPHDVPSASTTVQVTVAGDARRIENVVVLASPSPSCGKNTVRDEVTKPSAA